MKKAIKYISRFILAVLILIFSLLIIIPYFFKDEIADMVKDQASHYLDADLEFGGVSISAISSLPDLQVGISELKLVGKNAFDGVELIHAKQLILVVDLRKVLFNQKYEVKYISLSSPVIQLITLDNGESNYDIYKTDTIAEEDVGETNVDESPLKFKLEKYELNDAQVLYRDDIYKMFVHIDSLDHNGEFIMHADTFDLNTITKASTFNLEYEKVKLIDDVALKFLFNGAIAFENEDMIFQIRENMTSLNELDISFNGGIKMKPDSYELDVKLATINQSFRHFLSLIPLAYQKDFKNLEIEGEFNFESIFNGIYSDNDIPSFDILLEINNGYVKYPDLNDAIENIKLSFKTVFPGGSNYDDLQVSLESMNFSFLSSKFNMSFHGNHFISNPFISAELSSDLNLEELSKVYPIDSIFINGKFRTDINIKGSYSDIEKEQYDLFEAGGIFDLTDFEFTSKDLDNSVSIKNMSFEVLPHKLKIDKLLLKTGQSDFQLNGEISNYLPYVLRNEQLNGIFILNSSYLNLDELIPAYDNTSTDSTSLDSTELEAYNEVISIPENIYFRFESNINTLIYDSMPIKKFNGTMNIEDGKINLDQFNMQLFKGQISLNGTYFSISNQRAKLNMDLDIKNISFNESYTYFEAIKKYTPLVKYFDGNFSTFLEADVLLNEYYYPIYSEISSKGKLVSDEVKILSDSPIEKLKSYAPILFGDNNKMKDLNVSYSFTDGKFVMEETPLKLKDYTLSVSGFTSLDQEIGYKIETEIPINELKNSTNSLSSLLNETNVGINKGNMPFTITINGNLKNPTYSTSLGELKTDLLEKGKDIISEKVDKVKKDALEEAQKKADDIIRLAKLKAQQIRDEGNSKAILIENEATRNKVKADQKTKEEVSKLRDEGYKAADKLIEEAKSPLAKIAAEKTAKKMKSQTDKKADALELKLNAKSKKIQNVAFQQAKNLREEANSSADSVEKKAEEEANKILEAAKNK